MSPLYVRNISQQTCALGADPLDLARDAVSASSIRRHVNAILRLGLKPDDEGFRYGPVDRVVDAALRRQRSVGDVPIVLVLRRLGVVDLVASDHPVTPAVKRRLPLDSDRRRVDRLQAQSPRLSRHCAQ